MYPIVYILDLDACIFKSKSKPRHDGGSAAGGRAAAVVVVATARDRARRRRDATMASRGDRGGGARVNAFSRVIATLGTLRASARDATMRVRETADGCAARLDDERARVARDVARAVASVRREVRATATPMVSSRDGGGGKENDPRARGKADGARCVESLERVLSRALVVQPRLIRAMRGARRVKRDACVDVFVLRCVCVLDDACESRVRSFEREYG